MGMLGTKPHLARIRVYPIKSLDPLEVERVGLASGVRLAGDRDYALFDARGRFLNAKRLGPTILAIRAAFSDQARAVELVLGPDSGRFELPGESADLEAWFGRALGQAVSLGQDSAAGFPRHRRAGTSLALYPGYYRLAVNTRIEPLQAGTRLVVGDELTVVE